MTPQFNPSGDPDLVQNDTYVRYQPPISSSHDALDHLTQKANS